MWYQIIWVSYNHKDCLMSCVGCVKGRTNMCNKLHGEWAKNWILSFGQSCKDKEPICGSEDTWLYISGGSGSQSLEPGADKFLTSWCAVTAELAPPLLTIQREKIERQRASCESSICPFHYLFRRIIILFPSLLQSTPTTPFPARAISTVQILQRVGIHWSERTIVGRCTGWELYVARFD